MNTVVLHNWVFCSLTMLLNFHCSHAKEAHPFSQSYLQKPFINQLFLWRKQQMQLQQDHLQIYLHTILAGLFCFIAACISSAGGLGGGGLFLPILNIVAGLDLKTATTFTAFMVTGGSVANVLYHIVLYKNPILGTKKPSIDYDIALLCEPSMLLGVSIGVICNVVFPEWLITILFVVFLACSTFKTCICGVLYWREETNEVVRNGFCKIDNGVLGDDGLDNSDGGFGMKEPLLSSGEREECSATAWRKLGLLVTVWVFFFGVHLIRGDRDGQGLIKMEPCGVGYWLISSLQIPLALVSTIVALYQKDDLPSHNLTLQDEVAQNRNETHPKFIFSLMALLSGILGGLFGIGGGMLINPVLLHMGIPPQITAATTSFMVLFSSSMSSVQYLMLGMKNVNYALIFAAGCFLASLLGLAIVQRAIKKYGRVSLIVFSVGTVMALSTVLTTSFGVLDVWRMYEAGQYMGFSLPC